MTTFERLILLGILSSSLHWLIARAGITKFWWSRIKGFGAKLLECPACSGFWIGLGFGMLGIGLPLFERFWLNVLGNGFVCLFLTPVFEGFLLWGLSLSAITPAEQPVSDQAQVPETD